MQLVVRLPESDGDDIAVDVASGRLWGAGAAGIEERPGELIATFASADRAEAAQEVMGDLEVELRDPPDAADIQRWRAFAEPVRVAGDTVIAPTWWDGPVPASALAIPLDPGSAFGFGNHPTTASLAARLRAHPPRDATVLDLGCGSGLLSIVAARSGAARVVAVDVDTDARAVTRVNVRRNGVADRVTVAGRSIADADRDGPFDLILANVPVGVHEETASTTDRLLSPTGQIWATGVTAPQVDRVIAAHHRAGTGLVPVETIDLDGEWWLVVLGPD